MAPTRRRALPASEWKRVEKNVNTSALGPAGVKQPLQAIPDSELVAPPPKLPPVQNASTADDISLLEIKARKKTKHVSTVAAFNPKGEMLWGKRNDNQKWTTPGGHHEEGETPEAAAKRELFEESGLKPVKMEYLGHGMGGPKGDIKVHCFRATVGDGTPTSANDPDKEVSEWRWAHPDMVPVDLHNKNNVLLRLLGKQEGEVEKGMGGVQDEVWMTRTETNVVHPEPAIKGKDGVQTDPSTVARNVMPVQPMEKGQDGVQTDPSAVADNTESVPEMDVKKGGCAYCKQPATKLFGTAEGKAAIPGCDLHHLNAFKDAVETNGDGGKPGAQPSFVRRVKSVVPPPDPPPEDQAAPTEDFWSDPAGVLKPEDAGTDTAQVDLRAATDAKRCECESCAPMAAAPTHTTTNKEIAPNGSKPVLQPPEPDPGSPDKTNAPTGTASATEAATEGGPNVRKFIPILKALTNPTRRLVTGIVLQPEETDAQGDIYSSDVIEAAAHNFLAGYNRDTKSGYMHKEFGRVLEVVESWVVPVPMHIDGRLIKKGTWMMTMRVKDDDAWQKVVDGKIRGFSIGGVAKVHPVAA